MQSQTAEPDWYRYTLDVPMLTAPGDTIVYCSIEPNLAGGMLRKIAGEPLPEMFYRLVAKPLQMENYHLLLTRPARPTAVGTSVRPPGFPQAGAADGQSGPLGRPADHQPGLGAQVRLGITQPQQDSAVRLALEFG